MMKIKPRSDLVADRRVLIVDDDQSIEFILRRLIRNIDPHIKLDWTTSVEAAQIAIQKHRYEMILCDYDLGSSVTGLYLWRLLQHREQLIPFVMMTGLEVEDYLKIVSDLHMSPQLISKPFQIHHCLDVLSGILGTPA